MVNKSAAKGGAFERKIRDIFETYYDIPFERVPSSGALDYLKGDVWAPHHQHVWPYVIECKHYKELDFNSLLTAKSNDLYSFWEQATRQVEEQEEKSGRKKIALVVFRWNRSKNYVICELEEIPLEHIVVKAHGHAFCIALLDDWLKSNKLVKKLIDKDKNSL